MTIKQLIDRNIFSLINEGTDTERIINKPYCCDLLSVAMCSLSEGSIWITVMGNINTLAVASLKDACCIVLAEGSTLDDSALEKAKTQGITVFSTDSPIFESALLISEILND